MTSGDTVPKNYRFVIALVVCLLVVLIGWAGAGRLNPSSGKADAPKATPTVHPMLAAMHTANPRRPDPQADSSVGQARTPTPQSIAQPLINLVSAISDLLPDAPTATPAAVPPTNPPAATPAATPPARLAKSPPPRRPG